MGLLDKLWDDVVAGPKPSEGLGKLRRKSNPAGENGDRRFQQRSKSIAVPRRPPALNVECEASSPSSSSLPSTPLGSSPLNSPSPVPSPASRMRHSLFRQCNNSFTTQSDLMVISALDK
ncbi:hypothetical protein SELMODRAFT_413482 [Selaginella moellendorffii]|uniref:Uncharacterized protein n=1 Tax=Selaginella moellendorffii TaxID=88036 RepID=D8RPM0_SELML|nr:dormancy-associated protein homolog 3 [Selaginella moellendorffii]XP_002984419.1 dormancy-associated protein homolog 3 [Selaginella moellendorffii]EFJ14469.1 hypothetical protein SELMODRAFT_423639 [Selaginella moellendorffii]EFJ26068.1 hypothetical protein SELMODRAFT_413482 [Selaginella moellendorffii]|eukprot:XP_002972847.1 dormancy-associated protein homolog 3 [Selaginella moellendorffii]